MSTSFFDQYYLFTITLECGQVLRFTNASQPILNPQDVKEYLPKSALNIKLSNFNDNGNVLIILEGAYQQKGINENHQLMGCIVAISIFNPKNNQTKAFACCRCTKIEDFGRNFRIHLSSDLYKMRTNLATRYSKHCRAEFGDEKCRVNMEELSREYYIEEICGNTLTLTVKLVKAQKPNHYFDNGTATISIETGKVHRIIVSHILSEILSGSIQRETIVLQDPFPEFVIQYMMKVQTENAQKSKIVLAPGCNKLFETCCKYNNGSNFQGEPFLP